MVKRVAKQKINGQPSGQALVRHWSGRRPPPPFRGLLGRVMVKRGAKHRSDTGQTSGQAPVEGWSKRFSRQAARLPEDYQVSRWGKVETCGPPPHPRFN